MLPEVTSTMLMNYRDDVLYFESGEQYLEHLKSPNFIEPTAVLSDVTMPGINGYDLALEIRKVLPFQKIILITGNPDSKYHTKAAQQICFTLNKPFNPERFIAMAGDVSSCHQLHQTDQQQPYPQKCRIDSLFDCPFFTPVTCQN
jgi:DNA-binding NtrC family response regulator